MTATLCTCIGSALSADYFWGQATLAERKEDKTAPAYVDNMNRAKIAFGIHLVALGGVAVFTRQALRRLRETSPG